MSEPEPIALPDDREWISPAVASARLGIHPNQFAKVARAAGIRRRQYPGLSATYSAEDVQRVINYSVQVGPHEPRPRAKRKAAN